MESIDLRIWDTIKFYVQILNEEFDRASISAFDRCDFALENNRFCAHRILSREIDGTSDSARKFDRLCGGCILAQNPKYRRFPKQAMASWDKEGYLYCFVQPYFF